MDISVLTTTARGRRMPGLLLAVGLALTGSVLVAEPAAAASASIKVTPATGGPGSEVEISGANWVAGDTVVVTVLGAGVCNLTPDATGTIAPTACTLPSVANGSRQLAAEQDSGAKTATASVTIVARVTSISSANVSPGRSITEYAGGFKAASPLKAYLDSTSSTPLVTTPASPASDSTGSVSNLQITIPSGAAAGTHSLLLVDNAAHSAAKTIHVFTPTYAISPLTGGPGSYVQVSGSGWRPSDGLTFYVGTADMCGLTTDSSGAFNTVCTVPAVPAGTQSVLVEQDSSQVQSTGTFTVVPRVTYLPSPVVSPGVTIRVDTAGLAASSPVTVTLAGTSGALVTNPASPSTDTNGSLTNLQVTVPSGAAAGSHVLTVTDGSSDKATATITVYTPTITTAPTTSSPGKPVTLGATGFQPYGQIYISLNGSDFCNPVADSSGAVSASCALPATPAGAGTLSFQEDSAAVVASKAVTITPAVTYLPNPTVTPGAVIRVDTAGLAASSPVTVTLAGTRGNLVTNPATPSSDSNGSLTNLLVTLPARATAGAHVLSVHDGSGHTATYTITVYSPTVTVPSTSGSPQHYYLFSGTKFQPNTTVSIYLGGSYFCGPTTDSTGAFSSYCQLPAVPGGSQTLSFQQDGGAVTVTKAYTVVSSVNYLPYPNVSGGAMIRVDTYGLDANAAVTATLSGTHANLITNPATPSTDANGSMTNLIVTIPSGASTGDHTLTISSGTHSATATVTVYAPTLTLSETSGKAGTTYAVSGSGFWSGDNAYLYFGSTYTCGLGVDASGDVNGSCTVPSLASGAYPLTVQQSSASIDVSAGTFTIS